MRVAVLLAATLLPVPEAFIDESVEADVVGREAEEPLDDARVEAAPPELCDDVVPDEPGAPLGIVIPGIFE